MQRIQHNIFIHTQTLIQLVKNMKQIIKDDGYINIENLKQRYPISRKYLIAYLEHLDTLTEITKIETKRYLNTPQ